MIRLLMISGFALSAMGAAFADEAGLADGKALFEQEWAAEEGAAARGLGPLFNARSCESCHKEHGAAQSEEISQEAIARIAGFVRTLEHKPRGPSGPGRDVFAAVGCAACHKAEMPDRSGTPLAVFTDLLLHDLGESVAGAIPDDKFSPSEWRTAPLIDLDAMGGKRRYLHDGRAVTIEQAIRLHGGEAQGSREAFDRLAGEDKARLMEFLARL